MKGSKWIKLVLVVVVMGVLIGVVCSAGEKKEKKETKPKVKSTSGVGGAKKSASSAASEVKKPAKVVKGVFELLTPKHPVVNLDRDRYARFFKLPLRAEDLANVDIAKRTYATIMFFTGPRSQCQICHILEKTYRTVSKLYYDQYLESSTAYYTSDLKIAFSILEPKRVPEAFKEFQVSHLPVIVLIPPFAGPYAAQGSFAPKLYQFTVMQDLTMPKRLAAWIERETLEMVEGKNSEDRVHIHVPVPFYENEIVQTSVFVAVCLLALIQLPFLFRNFFHPWLWLCIGMVVFSFGFGGTVYNSMREIPIYQNNQDGTIQLFSSGLRSQYRAEGYIMAFAMMFLSAIWVFITIGLRKLPGALLKWFFFAALLGLMILVILWSVNVFSHHKMPGYPYDTRWPRV